MNVNTDLAFAVNFCFTETKAHFGAPTPGEAEYYSLGWVAGSLYRQFKSLRLEEVYKDR